MRTCPRCGCYIPDNWTTCPACNSQEKEKPIRNTACVYKVDILYDNHHLSYELFGQYENAVSYAKHKIKEQGVYATQIVHNKMIIKQFEKTS